ncbi:lactate utilization protein C [Sporolactobacillus shoreicorticis]|uniref:Lactate utilization protein C n=1 Tax=Sporolactobacillus shoreicorticis TaxID=1923877 RepID=A0ABW5S166_9BACL|nr:lactate utilization protein C [Sporolactobacillus shoreicorticis]MCO7126827.1 lactate utilization protein C [Sporolactobacillus shoreicorticis]
MNGTIENRDSFLEKIAGKLNRTPGEAPELPIWAHKPQERVYNDYSEEQLTVMMKKACEPIHTSVYETTLDGLAKQLVQLIDKYGAGKIVATKDERFEAFGLSNVLDSYQVYTWNYKEGRKNIDKAAEATIGLSICDVMLAESATAGLFNDKDKARSVSLLPETSVVIVPKSCIVPRMTQAMQLIENKVEHGEEVSSYINFISGPSNSADIEMRLVVGVHGPIKVAYIIVSDV